MAFVRELWLVDFGEPFPSEPAERRPALIVGPPGPFGPRFPISIVCPLTTTRRGLSLHVEVEPDPVNGLGTTSYVQCELVRSVARTRLVRHLGAIDDATAARVADLLTTLVAIG